MSGAVRFAPSPTGLLHVGNARIALVNWLFARKAGARFILRLDDTDPERSRPEFAAAIEEDLSWLGLEWDDCVRQSERLHNYHEALEGLKEGGRVYPCYETEEEIKAKRRRQLAKGRPPIYDRAALKLTEAEKKGFVDEGRKPHWRLRLEAGSVAWDDCFRGRVAVDAGSLSDPVLLRANGRPTYTLASVVDDIELGVTHILRGEDHLSNTAVQIQLLEALGADRDALAFGHLALLAGPEGESLSKRLGSLTLRGLREDGIEPMAVNSLLAKLGTSDPIQARAALEDLVLEFDPSKFSRATAKFDVSELERLSAKVLLSMSYGNIKDRLLALGLDKASDEFWRIAKWNIVRLRDAKEWYEVCYQEIRPRIVDRRLAEEAAKSLPPEPWDGTTWTKWSEALKAATGKEGKALFRPLRLALTGREHGPELKNLLPLIGRERALARLCGKAA